MKKFIFSLIAIIISFNIILIFVVATNTIGSLFFVNNNANFKYYDYYTYKRKSFVSNFTNIKKNGTRVGFIPSNPNKIKNFFFGGSSVWGSGVNDFNTLPSLYSKNTLSRSYNYGESDFNTIQSLNLFMISLLKNEIKGDNINIFFYNGYNNVINGCSNRNSGYATSRENYINTLIDHRPSSFKYFLLPFKHLYRNFKNFFFGNFVDLSGVNDCTSNYKKKELVSNSITETWNNAYQIAKSNNMNFYAILEPNIYTNTDFKDFNKITKWRNNQIKLIYEEIKKKKYDFNFIDLSEINLEKNLFIDDVHLNEKGNQEIIKKLLEKMGKI